MATRKMKICHCGRKYYGDGKECQVCRGEWVIRQGITYKKCKCIICGIEFEKRANAHNVKYCARHENNSGRVKTTRRTDCELCPFNPVCRGFSVPLMADFKCQAEKNIAHFPEQKYRAIQAKASYLYSLCEKGKAKKGNDTPLGGDPNSPMAASTLLWEIEKARLEFGLQR